MPMAFMCNDLGLLLVQQAQAYVYNQMQLYQIGLTAAGTQALLAKSDWLRNEPVNCPLLGGSKHC